MDAVTLRGTTPGCHDGRRPRRGRVRAGIAVELSALSASESEHLRVPSVRFMLSAWVTTYVAACLIAWRRRPDSTSALHDRRWRWNLHRDTRLVPQRSSTYDGSVLEQLPPISFLHTYLAFPTGRPHGRVERGIV